MFKAVNRETGEVRQFGYLQELAAVRGEGWTAGEDIDKAADDLNRRDVETQRENDYARNDLV